MSAFTLSSNSNDIFFSIVFIVVIKAIMSAIKFGVNIDPLTLRVFGHKESLFWLPDIFIILGPGRILFIDILVAQFLA